MPRTRIKICGLREAEHVAAAVDAGADAVGFVLYEPSVRAVTVADAARLSRNLPEHVTPVLLVVNATAQAIEHALATVPRALLQFHGDETPADCDRWGLPYLRAVPMQAGLDLLNFAQPFKNACALLLDAPVDGYGGGGKVFDWSLLSSLPPAFASPDAARAALGRAPIPLVLSGGLRAANVTDGITRVRPWAVDVSSGVEVSRGVKDANLIRQFCEAVRAADAAVAHGQA